MAYIKQLPINDTPEIFCLHDNANITFAQNETFNMLGGLLRLQPKSSSGGGKTREEVRHLLYFMNNLSYHEIKSNGMRLNMNVVI